MLQTFEKNIFSGTVDRRLLMLRKLFKSFKIDGYIVPHNDKFFNEMTPADACRLEWITGFSGSAGTAIIFKKKAALFTDGRYSIQIKLEVDQSKFSLINLAFSKPINWLEEEFNKKTVIGFDPWLHSISEIDRLKQKLSPCIKFKAVNNLIDVVWKDRPQQTASFAYKRPNRLSGKTAAIKLEEVTRILKLNSKRKLIITCPDSICWLANIRAQDVPNSPLLNCYAVANSNLITVYSENPSYRNNIIKFQNNVLIKHLDYFLSDLKPNDHMLIELERTPVIIKQKLVRNKIEYESVENPIHRLKSIKNKTEIDCSRKCHVRDGAAVVKFLSWMTRQEPMDFSEIDLVKKLEFFRQKDRSFVDISFNTICATGSNGAITHYRVTDNSNKKIGRNELILIDSGGQYEEGTTDITRTLINGKPNKKNRLLYTRVLQGLVCLSRIKWPAGLSGKDLDPLARQFLWESGVDYDHGTGHGVGAFSNVHQGPQAISRMNNTVLEEGMILSNEPGCYLKEEFGIRLENLIVIRAEKNPLFPKENLLFFETLTLAPFEKKLIEVSVLNKAEIDWINKYHKKVLTSLKPFLEKNEKNWLIEACKPI